MGITPTDFNDLLMMDGVVYSAPHIQLLATALFKHNGLSPPIMTDLCESRNYDGPNLPHINCTIWLKTH